MIGVGKELLTTDRASRKESSRTTFRSYMDSARSRITNVITWHLTTGCSLLLPAPHFVHHLQQVIPSFVGGHRAGSTAYIPRVGCAPWTNCGSQILPRKIQARTNFLMPSNVLCFGDPGAPDPRTKTRARPKIRPFHYRGWYMLPLVNIFSPWVTSPLVKTSPLLSISQRWPCSLPGFLSGIGWDVEFPSLMCVVRVYPPHQASRSVIYRS